MKVSLVLASALLACFAMVSPAQAETIDGMFTMAGDLNVTGGLDLSDATGIDFLGDDFIVITANGDFADEGVSTNDTGSIKDFTFSPLSGAPISAFWSIGNFKFELQSLNIEFQDASALKLLGFGYITHPDYDKTPGMWRLTTQSFFGATEKLSFSAHAIPEPASLSLMGLGALGLALARRRRKTAA